MEDNFFNNYHEILEFITKNKENISKDWELLLNIYRQLDRMLKDARNMSDLHKNTKILVEAMKLMQDLLFNEFKGDLTFEKLVTLGKNKELDDYFISVKQNTLGFKFLDHLNFDHIPRILNQRERQSTAIVGVAKEPETYNETYEDNFDTIIRALENKISTHGPIEYFKIIFDPDSYSKTVLNAFNLALAVRQKHLSLKSIKNVLYVVKYESTGTDLDHSVLQITPLQYENIRNKYL